MNPAAGIHYTKRHISPFRKTVWAQDGKFSAVHEINSPWSARGSLPCVRGWWERLSWAACAANYLKCFQTSDIAQNTGKGFLRNSDNLFQSGQGGGADQEKRGRYHIAALTTPLWREQLHLTRTLGGGGVSSSRTLCNESTQQQQQQKTQHATHECRNSNKMILLGIFLQTPQSHPRCWLCLPSLSLSRTHRLVNRKTFGNEKQPISRTRAQLRFIYRLYWFEWVTKELVERVCSGLVTVLCVRVSAVHGAGPGWAPHSNTFQHQR